MKLDEIVCWYQKKIGTYDKQQWEKTVEQKILSGFTNVTLKNTKLKTEFIDVDLVRGSTFPKAKPKQSLLTVIKFAILRYFFLPIYAKWWVSQTSPKILGLLLGLYTAQLINWALYSFHAHKVKTEGEHIVSLSELLIPMALSLILSFIHSQIVATNSANKSGTKRKRMLTTTGKPRERIRRRKKLVKMRSTDSESGNHCKFSSRSSQSLSGSSATLGNPCLKASIINSIKSTEISVQENFSRDNKVDDLPLEKTLLGNKDLEVNEGKSIDNIQTDDSCNVKKRNVNWDSPIHNYAKVSSNEIIITCNGNKKEKLDVANGGSPKIKTVRIDECIQEFYDDLLQCADDEKQDEAPHIAGDVPNISEQTGEDDGFESLNGKSSSGEENPNFDASNIEINQNGCNTDNPASQFKNEIRIRLCAQTASKTQDSLSNNVSNDGHSCKSNNECGDLNFVNLPAPCFRRKFPLSSESDIERNRKFLQKPLPHSEVLHKKVSILSNRGNESSETDEEGDDGEIVSSPPSIGNTTYTECTTSATEWLGVTTNSEECSYSSELDNSDFQQNFSEDGIEHDFAPTVILNPSCGSSDRISCTIWDHREVKKAEMSVLDISSCIIERVEAMPETCDYLYIGVAFSILLSFIPIFCRLCEATDIENPTEVNYLEIPLLVWEKASFSFTTILRFAFGETDWEKTVLIITFVQRLCLTYILFFLFTVAERTFKQRFLYAKLFSHLTSSRRAQKSDLPHFRLNKVRNIKTWLSVRSYLKRRGPQRSVDVIVSSAFIITLLLLAFLSVEWLKDSVQVHSQLNLEALLWSSALGIFLLRFMTLGNKINRKYRSISVLITEQINLYLQIEQKPKKKEELMVSNSVLKLAGDLLKELESPFKISGLSANPYLYTTIKVVILSALSGVLSEMLGFKLKLHKIKINREDIRCVSSIQWDASNVGIPNIFTVLSPKQKNTKK